MEKKTDALVLKSMDFRESDKIVTLLSSEYGKITAAVKGVRKAGAKLRFSAQPFCFAEYVLVQKADRHTVISASLYDSFHSLSEDLTTYYSACAVLEICDRLSYENLDSRILLVDAVNALRSFSREKNSVVLARFMIRALDFAGYPVRADECPFCGKKLSGRMRFDFESGSFACNECGKGAPASENTYRFVRSALEGTPLPEGDAAIRALRLLKFYFTKHTDAEFPALFEAVGILEDDE